MSPSTDLPVAFRAATLEDAPFVLDSWLSEMARSSFARYIPEDVFKRGHRGLVNGILQNSLCILACNPQDANHLYGCFCWTPGETPIAHWIYVKGNFQKNGIAKAMLMQAIPDTITNHKLIIASQANRLFKEVDLIKRYNVVYSPYIVLTPQP